MKLKSRWMYDVSSGMCFAGSAQKNIANRLGNANNKIIGVAKKWEESESVKKSAWDTNKKYEETEKERRMKLEKWAR